MRSHSGKAYSKKKLPRDFFDGLQYALAGLGDSSYPKYIGLVVSWTRDCNN